MYGFKLTQEAKSEGFSGGVLKVHTLGHAFDVGAALEEHDGLIVTDDGNLASILRSYPALEAVDEADLPDDHPLVEVPGQSETTIPEVGPPVPQTAPEGPALNPPPEVPAEHADQADSIEGELEQGKAVSGLASSGRRPAPPSASTPSTSSQSGED